MHWENRKYFVLLWVYNQMYVLIDNAQGVSQVADKTSVSSCLAHGHLYPSPTSPVSTAAPESHTSHNTSLPYVTIFSTLKRSCTSHVFPSNKHKASKSSQEAVTQGMRASHRFCFHAFLRISQKSLLSSLRQVLRRLHYKKWSEMRFNKASVLWSFMSLKKTKFPVDSHKSLPTFSPYIFLWLNPFFFPYQHQE